MKPFKDFLSDQYKALKSTLLFWPLILLINTFLLITFVEKKNIDETLNHQIVANLFLYDHFSYLEPSSDERSFTYYLKKNDRYYDPKTGADLPAPTIESSDKRYIVKESKSGLIIIADRFSFYSTFLLKMTRYVPISIMLFVTSLFLFKDLTQFWIRRYEALSILLTNSNRGNYSNLIRPLPLDLLRGMLFSLNRSVISLNELYVSLNGWIKELKDLNLSKQINLKVDQINRTLQEKYQFTGETIHLSLVNIPISPSSFMIFLLSFSEAFFIPFFNFYFVQNIKSSFLNYFLALLILFFSYLLYSQFQRLQNKSMIVIISGLYISVIGKIILGYEIINNQEVILFYALSVIGQIVAIGLYLFLMFKPIEIKKIAFYLLSGMIFGLLTGWILQTSELAIQALLYTIFCTYLAIMYFSFMPKENHR